MWPNAFFLSQNYHNKYGKKPKMNARSVIFKKTAQSGHPDPSVGTRNGLAEQCDQIGGDFASRATVHKYSQPMNYVNLDFLISG
jgi:hypothetical protein